MEKIIRDIDVGEIQTSIDMLKRYVTEGDIGSLIDALENLKQDPSNSSLLDQLIETFEELGVAQGAVLTYAPYINSFVSDDPFGDGS